MREKGCSAKATEAEAGQRPVPPRATPAECPFSLHSQSLGRWAENLTRHTLVSLDDINWDFHPLFLLASNGLDWSRPPKVILWDAVEFDQEAPRVTVVVVEAYHKINWDGRLNIDAGPFTLTFTLLEIPAVQPPLDLFSIKLSAE